MDVPVSTLRAELKSWIERVRAGETVIITERGVPVAQLTPVGAAGLIADLERDGLIAPPLEAERPSAAADDRPRWRHSGDAVPVDAGPSGAAPTEPAAIHPPSADRRRVPDAPLAGIMRRRRR